MRSLNKLKLSSSATESEERAPSVVSTATSVSLPLQSTGTQSNVQKKHTIWCENGVSQVHDTYGCVEGGGNITTVKGRELMQRRHLDGRYIPSSCCAGSVFSVQASVLNWRLQRLKMRETQVNLSSSDHFNEA